MAATHSLDFLLVTALPDEFQAVQELVGLTLHPELPLFLGTLIGKGRVHIGVVDVGAMGPDEVGSFLEARLRDAKPQLGCVLLGIAAGFPEADVALGDVLVPYWIVPCGPGKVVEVPGADGEGKRTEVLHRGEPEPVSLQLFDEIRPVALDPKGNWASRMNVPRPDRETRLPKVHCDRSYVVGAVPRVIATDLAEDRTWLLSKFPPDSHRSAIGLEMESYSAQLACRREGVELLMVKGVQDDSTGAKDEPGLKDAWRRYAARAAAAFVVSCLPRIAARLERRDTWAERFREWQEELASSFRSTAPEPRFRYRVSPNLQSGRGGRRSLRRRPRPEQLLRPTDAAPFLLLRGGGGGGKTEILRRLFTTFLGGGLCPVLLSLRQYAELGVEEGAAERDGEIRTDPAEVIGWGSAPRCSIEQLTRLTRERRVVVLLDGLNEVAQEVREIVVQTLRSLHKEGTSYIVATDRLGPSTKLPGFQEWVVERLEKANAATLYDEEFGTESFERLSGRLQEIVRLPFFLNLALRSKQSYGAHRLQSQIFANFLEIQLRLSTETVDALAKSAMDSIEQHGVLDAGRFRHLVRDEAVYEQLVAAEVLRQHTGAFEHDLWRDYLVSRELAHQEEWSYERLDRATTFAGSRECVLMAIEQLNRQERRDRFVKAVFDWHYVAAVDCLAALPPDEEGDPVGTQTRVAVLGAIGEKRFDRVVRTRRRAEELLLQHHYKEAEPFRMATSRGQLAEYLARQVSDEGWYQSWQRLFTRAEGEVLSDEELELVASRDALLGWVAANAVRRCSLSENQLERLRSLYTASAGVEGGYVRWRVIHALGAFASRENAALLLRTLQEDSFEWARYGAARSVLEIAAAGDKELRAWIVDSLARFVQGAAPRNRWMQSKIVFEILACTIIDDAPNGWTDATDPLWRALSPLLEEEARDQLNSLRSDSGSQ